MNLDPSGDGVEEIITPPTDGPSTIVIITPTEDTPKTEPEKNPTTGANDMVAAAAALMAVSALGMAVLSRIRPKALPRRGSFCCAGRDGGAAFRHSAGNGKQKYCGGAVPGASTKQKHLLYEALGVSEKVW